MTRAHARVCICEEKIENIAPRTGMNASRANTQLCKMLSKIKQVLGIGPPKKPNVRRSKRRSFVALRGRDGLIRLDVAPNGNVDFRRMFVWFVENFTHFRYVLITGTKHMQKESSGKHPSMQLNSLTHQLDIHEIIIRNADDRERLLKCTSSRAIVRLVESPSYITPENWCEYYIVQTTVNIDSVYLDPSGWVISGKVGDAYPFCYESKTNYFDLARKHMVTNIIQTHGKHLYLIESCAWRIGKPTCAELLSTFQHDLFKVSTF